MSKNSIRIPPFYYIHVLDKNSNITRLEMGPQTFIRQDHESLVSGETPLKMIVLRPRTYCGVTNPVIRDEKGGLIYDKYGQVIVKYGDVEFRFFENYRQPFPLYPKEVLTKAPEALPIVKELSALMIEAIRNFKDDSGNDRLAGDQWLVEGPTTYKPRIEEKIVKEIKAQTIKEQEALKLRAREALVDRNGRKRIAGEEWLIREPGAYLPGVYEEIVILQNAFILYDNRALQLRATQNFVDIYKIPRKAGEEWLVTIEQSSYHLIDVYEEFVNIIPLTILNVDQYCIVLNPFDSKTGKNRNGAKELRIGQTQFFLQPGEYLQTGIKDVFLLEDNEALLLKANEVFDKHKPGDRWMVHGPCKYIPSIQIEVLEKRRVIPLDKNEGIYVKDIRTGAVRTVIGESYMLKAHEELYELELPDIAEKILAKESKYKDQKRLKYKLVTLRCPYNSAVQIYDFKRKNSRVVFGPNLVMLGPHEQFTVTILSGGMPKRPGVLTKIQIDLGPVFSSDIINVETSDHAALKLTVAYNWLFRCDKSNQEEAQKIFAVKDFVGDLCNVMASKIRAAVASVDFDTFHKTSARLIRKAVFGVDNDNKINKELLFAKNNSVVSNVDIQSIEPVDQITRDSLQKTVALAIEITTKRQEAQARHNADKLDQEAKGELQKLVIEDDIKAEEEKKKLLELQAKSQTIKNQGVAIANAKAKAEGEEISAHANLKNAELKSNAKKINYEAEISIDSKRKSVILAHQRKMNELDIFKDKRLAEIETYKFQQMAEAIGKDTIIAMANAGPEMQAELLKGLGLQGFIMTDGNNPINLFNTAQGLIGGPAPIN